MQFLTLTSIGIFISWWAHKTYAYKEKLQELKELKKTICDFRINLEKTFNRFERKQGLNSKNDLKKLFFIIIQKYSVTIDSLVYTDINLRKKISKFIEKQTDNTKIIWNLSKPDVFWRGFDIFYNEIIEQIDNEAEKYT